MSEDATTGRPGPSQGAARALLDGEGLARTLARIAHELIESTDDLSSLVLIGIHTRGVPLAERLRALISERSGVVLELGTVDIAFHRDDVVLRAGAAPRHAHPVLHGTELRFVPEGKTCILVDDVLSTGRTIRAAIDALLEFGRPDRIQLAVLIDRGHRELPIRPDYVGKNVPTAADERVYVRLREIDGADEVIVVGREEVTG
jgi:pyrimidine operon attenuation protein / uracil phosphoribosyltransferase